MNDPLPPPRRTHGLARSFAFAFAGIATLITTQRNARVHVAAAVVAVTLGLWLGLGRLEWAMLTLAIAAVLVLEGLNTAIEAAVDLASPQLHPLAKRAKDVAAGMVLLAAIASLVLGVLIFGPRLLERLGG
jgi:diacylglycerol kinase